LHQSNTRSILPRVRFIVSVLVSQCGSMVRNTAAVSMSATAMLPRVG